MKRAMLTTMIALLAAITATPLAAQVPKTVSYQGVLTDDEGTAVPDGDYDFTFRIYNAATDGSALWTEVTVVTVVKATFNAILGATVPLDLPFDRPYWLGIQVEGNPELTPRIQLTASPYALSVADGAAVTSINGLTDSVTLAAGANVTITPAGNTLTIAAAGAGSDGDWTVSGDDIYAAVPGNVGIGTASPGSRLHIRQDHNQAVGLTIENTDAGNLSAEYLEFADENGGLAWMGAFDDNSGYGSALIIANNRPGGYLRFHTGNAERMRVEETGDVGLGTSQPLARVHVQDYEVEVPAASLHSDDVVVESQDAILGLYSTASGSSGSGLSLGEIQGGLLQDKWSIIRQTSGAGGALLFNYGPNPDPLTNGTNMYIDDTGKVGIGTTNPGADLEVSGQVKITGGAPGAGRVLTSDAGGLASWQAVTAEYWFSPHPLVGEGGYWEITAASEGYVKVRADAAGIVVAELPIDLPGKISGVQQKLKGITFHYKVEQFSEHVQDIAVKRLNPDGTATTLWTLGSGFLNSTTWTSYTWTDSSPEAITGPIVLRLDLSFEFYTGPEHEIYIGGVKAVTTE